MSSIVPPRGAVIGTGRSGTGYMAALLKNAGLDTGHESYWHAIPTQRRASQLDVDSSWLALPHIEAGRWHGRVLHVVRHPLDTIRSLMANGFFSAHESSTLYPMYARAHATTVYGRYDLAAAVEFWCEWNNRCAAVADATIRVEDCRTMAFHDTVARVFPWATSDNDIARAADRTDQRTNTRGPVPHIDPQEVWRMIGRRAHGYGYGE